MNTDTILRLLQNSGFHILGFDGTFLYLEDPSCILRSFETFIEYAWVIITCITGLLLFGWAISMIRGAKNDIFTNSELSQYDEFNLYENLTVYDSGAPNEIPYADAPLMATDVPPVPESVTVTPDNNTIRTDTPGRPSRTQSARPSRGENVRTGVVGRPSHARASSNDVIYTNADGTQYRKTGGTRAWRNNNPGNIRYSEFARRVGAIGEAGGFAVFPDEETGMRAIGQLLRSDSYNRLTVAGAISRYAPPSENNTAAYHRRIQELTGLSINRRMSELNDAELARVVGAIRQIEGWQVGRVVEN